MDKLNLFKQLQPDSTLKKHVQEKLAVIYTRVSTKGQAETNFSLETQLESCKSYARLNGWAVAKEFGGTYESAKEDLKRAEFTKMLQFLKKNTNIRCVIVTTYDRFSRTGASSIGIVEQLAKNGICVVATKEDIDVSTPTGNAMRSMKMIFSQLDNEARKQKCGDGTKNLLRKGGWPKKPPIGYTKSEKDINGVKKSFINKQGKLLQKAFQQKIYEGKGNSEIQKWLESMGLTIDRKRLTDIFKNPFYCGVNVDKMLGEPVRGIQEKMITEDEFLILNGITNRFLKSAKEFSDEYFPLKGTVMCDICHKPLTAYHVNGKFCKYMKCNTLACNVNANINHLHKKFLVFIQPYQISHSLIEPLKKQLKLTFMYLNKTQKDNHDLIANVLKTKEKDFSIIKRRYAIGEISYELYDEVSTEIITEMTRLQNELDKTNLQLSNLERYIDFSLEMGGNVQEIWNLCGIKGKKNLQKMIFPNGILYSKKNDSYRTLKVNSFFELISSFSECMINKKAGQNYQNVEMSGLVHSNGIEPLS
jgi:site-specific DNA recombinase